MWHHPLRLDNKLYIEVVFNQIAPDYLEGLLLVMPSEQIDQDVVYQVARVAALLHRAADMDHVPTLKETKFLLPKPALSARDIKPPQWVNMVTFRYALIMFYNIKINDNNRSRAAGPRCRTSPPARPRLRCSRLCPSGSCLDPASSR